MVEIFSKKYIGADYTQTEEEAVDVGGANFGALQLWLEPALSGSDTITIQVQHANVLDDSAFDDAGTWSRQFSSSSTSTSIETSTQFGRYLRLKITTSLSGVGANLRGVLVLKDAG